MITEPLSAAMRKRTLWMPLLIWYYSDVDGIRGACGSKQWFTWESCCSSSSLGHIEAAELLAIFQHYPIKARPTHASSTPADFGPAASAKPTRCQPKHHRYKPPTPTTSNRIVNNPLAKLCDSPTQFTRHTFLWQYHFVNCHIVYVCQRVHYSCLVWFVDPKVLVFFLFWERRIDGK